MWDPDEKKRTFISADDPGWNVPKPMGNDNFTASPSGTFATGDGLLNIAANKQEQFELVCDVGGRPELKTDPRFALRQSRLDNRAELKAVLDPLSRWEYGTEQKAAVERAKTYISGSDSGVLAAVFVSSINEWKVAQPRVLVLSNSAYYRVTYNPKNGKIDHFNKTGLEKIRVLEKTVTGLKVYLSEQDGRTSVGKWMSSWTKKEKARAREQLRQIAPLKGRS